VGEFVNFVATGNVNQNMPLIIRIERHQESSSRVQRPETTVFFVIFRPLRPTGVSAWRVAGQIVHHDGPLFFSFHELDPFNNDPFSIGSEQNRHGIPGKIIELTFNMAWVGRKQIP
jgi:hypothetical protein